MPPANGPQGNVVFISCQPKYCVPSMKVTEASRSGLKDARNLVSADGALKRKTSEFEILTAVPRARVSRKRKRGRQLPNISKVGIETAAVTTQSHRTNSRRPIHLAIPGTSALAPHIFTFC